MDEIIGGENPNKMIFGSRRRNREGGSIDIRGDSFFQSHLIYRHAPSNLLLSQNAERKGKRCLLPRGEFLFSAGIKHFNAWKGISLWSDMRGRISTKRVDIDVVEWMVKLEFYMTPNIFRIDHSSCQSFHTPSTSLPSPLPLYIRANVSARFIFLSRYTFYFLSFFLFFPDIPLCYWQGWMVWK